jgi:hypothetical protein
VPRVRVYSLADVVRIGDETRDATLRLVPFAEANEYRIWIPLPSRNDHLARNTILRAGNQQVTRHPRGLKEMSDSRPRVQASIGLPETRRGNVNTT